jgi:hypothetical protein
MMASSQDFYFVRGAYVMLRGGDKVLALRVAQKQH